MHDEVEFLIEQFLARKDEANAGGPVRDPKCPDVTLLMAVALDQAPADTQREVEEHSAHCDDCRWRLEEYRKYFRDEDIPEPPIKGSLLEIAADRREFVLKRPPVPKDRTPSPSLDEPPIGQGTSISFTQMARDPKRWPDDLVNPEPADADDARQKRLALEALALLVERGPSPSSPLTPVARYGSAPDVMDLRQRVGRSLFDILRGDLEIEVGPLCEAVLGTEILRQVFDDSGTASAEAGTAPSFRELDRWLNQLRQRFRRSQVMGELELRPSDQALRQLTPQLLEEHNSSWSYQLSFRLFLRSRLLEFCRTRGLRPRPPERGGRFTDLDAAFDALTRERLGEVLRAAAADDDPDLRDWLMREELSAGAP
jgi:hypothetical protein